MPAFVGRARELAEVEAAMKRSRLVTVMGASGIGKTRLALEVAARLGPRYRGGTWLVELTPDDDESTIATGVAAALGLDPEPGRDAVDVIVAHLPRAPVLLVLDNCEHLVEACAALVRRLLTSQPEVRVLATSQHPLRVPGESVLNLPPLSLPGGGHLFSVEAALESEAVALFCTRAAAGHSGFCLTEEVLPAVVEVCRRLDGIPLAIELAAARASVLSPSEIAERLDERFTLLRAQVAGSSRHTSLKAALDWSYRLLSAPEAALLRRLSVFAGGSSLRAVEAVCVGGQVDGDELVDLLSSLVAKCLVSADTTRARARYRLLESIQAYGRDELAGGGEAEELEFRHASWCVTLAERSWHQGGLAEQSEADERKTEYENLRTALQRCVGGLNPDLGLRLAAALTPLWRVQGLFAEGQAWLERALGAADEATPALRARALCALGSLAILRGDVAVARAAVEESLALARANGYERAMTSALNLLGFICVFTQDPEAAVPLVEESVARARAAGDNSSLASALGLYGRCRLFLGDLEEARLAFEECVSVSGTAEPAGALIGLGWVALTQGRLGEADDALSRALPLLRAAGDRFESALVLSFLGELAWVRGDLDSAREVLEEGIELAEAMGAPFPLSRCLLVLGLVAGTSGDPGAATRLVDDALNRARLAKLPYALIRCLHARGDIRRRSAHSESARAAYNEALALSRENLDKDGTATSLERLARLARDQGHTEKAVRLIDEALALYVEMEHVAGVALCLERLAGLALDQGRGAHAARLFGAAEDRRESTSAMRPPDQAGDAATDLAALRLALGGDLDESWAQGRALGAEEAVALATRGRGRRPDKGAGLASLTAGERQVADLAAEGLTNREIAERLFVSPRTVQGHLGRMYRKLGISSRRQLRDLYRAG